MELKQLNKTVVLLALVINVNIFSQMKMADIDGKEFSINLKTQNKKYYKSIR